MGLAGLIRPRPLGRWGEMSPFAPAVFLGAFLLFQAELILGKYLLPWFGGTPAVWTTCMLFFQVLLLLGYAYAHLVASRLGPRAQKRVHLFLLLASAGLLAVLGLLWETPITPGTSWRPSGSDWPISSILCILAASVGLPFFTLSATGPLLQSWFARLRPGSSPYRLYALSNLGSLLSLIGYPFLLEPGLSLRTQARLWSLGYLAFCLFCGACALRIGGKATPAPPLFPEPGRPEETGEAAPSGEARPGAGLRLLWLGLSASASVMLLATTNQMCREVAVVPFLWVLPLSLYLLSFIICFQDQRWYSRGVWTPVLALSSALACFALHRGASASLSTQVAAYCLVLFASCMACHGELFRARPGPRHLTSFYLTVALGGAAGGVLVGIAAPLLFRSYWEFHLGLLSTVVLVLAAAVRDRGSWLRASRRLLARVGRVSAPAGVLILGTALFLVARLEVKGSVSLSRSFYGVLQVVERGSRDSEFHALSLKHGRITHGFQFQGESLRRRPTSYYGERSGVGLAILELTRRSEDGGGGGRLRIGAIGLGVGTLAAYARPGDSIRFYELDPEVLRLSRGPARRFRYLEDCRGTVEVALGDARISLEDALREGRPGGFDLLAVDAFSSDAIPVHLLTREAFEVYRRHLRPGGVLAFHVTNRSLDLRPVVWALADRSGLASAWIDSPGEDAAAGAAATYRSSWILVTEDGELLRRPAISAATASRPERPVPSEPWTDDFSHLFGVLKLGG